MNDTKHGGGWPTAALSFVLGALAGATVVMLTAPNARRKHAERKRGLFSDLGEQTSATINTAGDRVASAGSQGRRFVDEQDSVVECAVGAGDAACHAGCSRAACGDEPVASGAQGDRARCGQRCGIAMHENLKRVEMPTRPSTCSAASREPWLRFQPEVQATGTAWSSAPKHAGAER